jgi:hypothetical protein
MNAIITDIEDGIADVENRLGVEEKKVVAALKPLITSIVAAGKADLVADVETDIPAVATALLTSGEAAALTTAAGEITSQVATQGKQLEQTAVTGLAAAAVALAKSSSSSAGGSSTSGASTAAVGTAPASTPAAS